MLTRSRTGETAMDRQTIDLPTAPPVLPFDEATQVLTALDQLEAGLMAEVARLSQRSAPRCRRPGVGRFRDRDLWWWRYSLVCWAHSRAGRNAFHADLLRGLRAMLKDSDDATLLAFLRHLDGPA